MSTREKEETPGRKTVAQVRALGEALGLHQAFIRDVAARGQPAIIDRADVTDETGALGVVLFTLQQLGYWLQDRAAQGPKPARPGELVEAVGLIARQLNVNPGLLVKVVGAAHEVYTQALEVLIAKERGAYEAEDADNTGGSGGPAS